MDFVSKNGYRESNCIDNSHWIGNHAHSFYTIAVTICRWSWRTKFTKNESNLNWNLNEWSYLKYRIAYALFLCVPIWKKNKGSWSLSATYCNKKKKKRTTTATGGCFGFPSNLTVFRIYSHSKPLNSYLKKTKLK